MPIGSQQCVFFNFVKYVGWQSCPSGLSHIQICVGDEGGSRIPPIIWWLVGIYSLNMMSLDFSLHNMVTWAHFFQKKLLCTFCTFLSFLLANLWIFSLIWAHYFPKNALCTFCTFSLFFLDNLWMFMVIWALILMWSQANFEDISERNTK